jgi:hypothetical protein
MLLRSPSSAALDGLQPATEICRGTIRLLIELGFAPLAEVTLRTGRRLDLLALGPDGVLVGVEVKSCRADFLADGKWPDYLEWVDRFFFAVAPDFPVDLLPAGEGLILADRYHAEIVRTGATRAVAAARRRALTLRFARIAAARLQGRDDPDMLLGRA